MKWKHAAHIEKRMRAHVRQRIDESIAELMRRETENYPAERLQVQAPMGSTTPVGKTELQQWVTCMFERAVERAGRNPPDAQCALDQLMYALPPPPAGYEDRDALREELTPRTSAVDLGSFGALFERARELYK